MGFYVHVYSSIIRMLYFFYIESYIEQELIRLKDKTVKDDQTRRDVSDIISYYV